MARSLLDVTASTFKSCAETLHEKFIQISEDSACAGCQSAGFGEAILATWLQTAWINFTHDLIIASALGSRRKRRTPIRAITGVRSRDEAKNKVKSAAACTASKFGYNYPVWHSPPFAIEVGDRLGLNNQPIIKAALGATLVPRQITVFRDYLVHPGTRTRQKYEELQANLGMHLLEPEHLLHQLQRPGLPVFTSWVRELQQIADAATQ